MPRGILSDVHVSWIVQITGYVLSVYGLLIGKKTSDYDQFFNRMMDTEDFNPESIQTDFEFATIKIGQVIVPQRRS